MAPPPADEAASALLALAVQLGLPEIDDAESVAGVLSHLLHADTRALFLFAVLPVLLRFEVPQFVWRALATLIEVQCLKGDGKADGGPTYYLKHLIAATIFLPSVGAGLWASWR